MTNPDGVPSFGVDVIQDTEVIGTGTLQYGNSLVVAGSYELPLQLPCQFQFAYTPAQFGDGCEVEVGWPGLSEIPLQNATYRVLGGTSDVEIYIYEVAKIRVIWDSPAWAPSKPTGVRISVTPDDTGNEVMLYFRFNDLGV